MTPSEHMEMDPVVRRFVEDAGSLSQSFGAGRVIGQTYALLYFSAAPLSLAVMQKMLGISKGSVSTAVRQLEQLRAVRKVWIKGDRKDYYAAEDWLGSVLKNALVDTVGKKLTSYAGLLEEIEHDLDSDNGEDNRFIRKKIEKLRAFQKKAETLWSNPVIEKILR